MRTYTVKDITIKGVDVQALEQPEICVPEKEVVTCNGKPLSPCMYLRNVDRIEVVSFDYGESFYCSYQSWDRILKGDLG